MKAILNNEPLIIKGNGLQYRPFTYISDCIIAIFLIMEKGKNLFPYNMANNNSFVSIKELAELLIQKAFPEKKLDYFVKHPSNQQDIPYSVDTKRLENLGWAPVYDIVSGFRRTVKSFI